MPLQKPFTARKALTDGMVHEAEFEVNDGEYFEGAAGSDFVFTQNGWAQKVTVHGKNHRLFLSKERPEP